ncbi:hypothetical protein [Streptomyces triculaminicus]|uniref:hypothetical protein n=1 Tax=Streptomyces triculaminicus TaxID=2816232 RepID=UPI00378979AE
MLVRVDRQTPVDEPLLSSLIAVNDTDPAKIFQRLGSRLGRDVPLSPKVARSWWQTETLRLHQIWRHQ